MSAYQFSNYRLRRTTEQDRALIAEWIAADPDHKDRVSAEFFDCKELGVECYLLEDKFGQPIFFFRQERALRIHIQFGPMASPAERERNQDAITQGFLWLHSMAKQNGFRQIIFESTVAPLIRFCERRFGFKKSPNELVSGIEPLTPNAAQGKSLHSDQQTA